MSKFPFFKQPGQMDCGATCIRMIAKYNGRSISIEKLRRVSETTREGTTLRRIAETSERIGFRSLGVRISFRELLEEAPLPCIVHWDQNHFVVVIKVKNGKVWVADPAKEIIVFDEQEFIEHWIGADANQETKEGIALLLEPTPRLNQHESDDQEKSNGLSFLYKYLFRYKKFIIQLVIGLAAASLLQLVFPFLTQSIVDIGIQNKDIGFIYLILIAQLFLFIGRTTIEVVRGWILLHLSARINISLVSDFFIKLMKLPIGYFDSKMTGDLMQRINDHSRIESLLTNQSLSVLFSFFNLIVFSTVLAWYDLRIFVVFLIGSTLYFTWIIIFLKRRKKIDYQRFSQMGAEQSKVIELINGMQEIKLHNAERQKRWGWEFLQARLFKISMKSLALEQTQTIGSNFINELKNIFVSFYSAKLVIDGDITLGMMVSISYIIGQLNGPVYQLIGFIYSVQDARIALERLSEIHDLKDESKIENESFSNVSSEDDLIIKDLSFRYKGAFDTVLNSVNVTIPGRKVTAIVGSSGSGKTTLMKLLLKFYEPTTGVIQSGQTDLNNVDQHTWRDKSGVVMQEGYIFNDTIANNIALGSDFIDVNLLKKASKIANIDSFIETLPLSYNTKIGQEGMGLSTGQKQRILIARAVYKDPEIIFFDEATSALDARNERVIMQNLQEFFKKRTAIVIAHRLSTVKNADQIIVLEHGEVVEIGSHDKLIKAKGSYYQLVKNQLQLEKLESK